MPTLLKRILFIAILLTIAYGIYRLIDKQGADDLKDNVVTTTQETAKSFGFDKDEVEEIFNPVIESSSESLGDTTEIIYENNIVVSDPEIREPVKTQPTTTKTNTTVKKTTTTSSSNILFQLFK